MTTTLPLNHVVCRSCYGVREDEGCNPCRSCHGAGHILNPLIAERYSCTSPRQMIDWLGDKADKTRLIAAANIVRQLWDARTSAYDWRQQGNNHVDWLKYLTDIYDNGKVIVDACNVIRCLFRNPLVERERVACPECNDGLGYDRYFTITIGECEVCNGKGTIDAPLTDPRWLSSTVLDLAKVVRGSGPNGDWPSGGDWTHSPPRPELMPILGDALLDAGCDDDEVIEHCMGDGPHVAGCFVLEAILPGL